MLTLAVGPEHHDLPIICKNSSNVAGRLIFDSEVIHLSNIEIEIKNLKFFINKLAKKNISISLKLKNEGLIYQSNFTNPIEPYSIDVNKKQIVYSWINNEEDKLILKIRDFGLTDLCNASLTLNVFDTKLEKIENFNANNKSSLKNIKEINGEKLIYKLGDSLGSHNYNIQKLISENSNTMTKQSSIIFKQASFFHKSAFPKKNSDNTFCQ